VFPLRRVDGVVLVVEWWREGRSIGFYLPLGEEFGFGLSAASLGWGVSGYG